ncbi:DEAD/DEAH box helicase, partial [Schleiferiaceae bacterium]|nr:DEAD/DEAH box helicase [Schleiferiaceae bacterium]
QSMKKRMGVLENVGLIIIDEAHHSVAKSYVQILRAFPKALQLGVTATPIRLNGEGFRHLFDELLCSYGVKEFMSRGFLSNYRHIATSFIDLKKLAVGKTRDFTEESLMDVMGQETVMANVVQGYFDHANGKKAIVFAVTIVHCHMLAERFKMRGVRAEVISSLTEKEERSKLLESFIQGEIKVLVNVNIFSEGFDCPDIEAVILARPTKSIAMYYQQVGRVLRPHKDKVHGIVLDNAMLWKEHGLVTQDITWTLDAAEIIKDTQAEISEGMKLPSGISLPEIIEDDSLGMEMIEETTNDQLVGIDLVVALAAVFKGQLSLFDTLSDDLLGFVFQPITVAQEIKHLQIGETSIPLHEPFFTVAAYLDLLGLESPSEILEWKQGQRLYSKVASANYDAFEEVMSWLQLHDACNHFAYETICVQLADAMEIAVRKGILSDVNDIIELKNQLLNYQENTINRVIEKLSISELVNC